MTAPATARRRSRLQRSAVTVALALLLTACAPWGAPGQGPGGAGHMSADDMPMGQMRPGVAEGPDEQAPDPREGASGVRVSATEMAFTPAALELDAGEPVNVTVANDGDVFHDFDLPAAGVHLGLDPGEQATTAVDIDEPGTYQATCTVAGHANAGMTLNVEVT